MSSKTTYLTVAVFAILCVASSRAVADSPAPAPFLATRDFSWQSLADPENVFYPAYFWLWNGPLDPTVLKQQLADMAAHDARNVAVLPEPHEFRPTTLNSQMDVDYLSPAYFDRVKVAVGEASRLGMNYWLYDEGGWPSGSAAGRVVQTRPDSASYAMVYDGKGNWNLQHGGYVDLLNPETTATFIGLTHQRYADAVGSYFGNTIKMTFTDEARYGGVAPGAYVPWTTGADTMFQEKFGYSLKANLAAFQVTNPASLTQAQKQVRADAFDFWSGQFRDAYFEPIKEWDRENGLASGGHVGGEDETFGAIKYGFGSVMRQLRAMDVPSVDAIWRQIFPGKETENNFPKFASSVAHQNGTALVMSESFCVYGDGLTPAQMKWVTDYERVRGVTLQVNGGYPLSTQDHLMEGERPHFGPTNPLWDFLPDLHRYTARVDQVLASGQPVIDTALYYPVRDMWANGNSSDPAISGFNQLTQALLERQCDYDMIDDDILNDPATQIVDGRLRLGAMSYRTIVVGPSQWMSSTAQQRLAAFEAAGGQVVRIGNITQIDTAIAQIAPTIGLSVASSGMRVVQRRWEGGGAIFLFNEGQSAYSGTASIAVDGTLYEVEPATGVTRALAVDKLTGGKSAVSLNLAPGESMLLVSQPSGSAPTHVASPSKQTVVDSITLADGWKARVDARYVVGQHNYEIQTMDGAQFQSVAMGRWATTLGLGEDFSGHVTYERTVTLPESFRGGRLLLDLGDMEYAARVLIDGKEVGNVLWSPWCLELPLLGDRSEFTLTIEMSNTLANELTSQRVRDLWGQMSGAGWPSDYNAQAWTFESESRGGGLLGPVRLQLLVPEPSPLALVATGFTALLVYGYHKHRATRKIEDSLAASGWADETTSPLPLPGAGLRR